MFDWGMMQGFGSRQGWTAQILLTQNLAPSEPTALSGSQGFLVLIAGLVLAFAFQLLLTNFFIALGISYSDSEPRSNSDDGQSPDDVETKINKIGVTVGLRALGTVSITLFIACFLAVKLCLANNTTLGAILGLVIWATYFSILVWISATSVGSVLGSVLDKATSGLQGIVGTAAVTFSAKTVSNQVGATAQSAAETVRRELSEAVDPVSARSAINKYLKKLQLSEAERQKIEAEFEQLVTEPEMEAIAKHNHLENIRRTTFVDLLSSRTELSKQDVSWVLDQVENVWQQLWQSPSKEQQTVPVLADVSPDSQTKPLSTDLERLIEQTRQQQSRRQAEATQTVAETAAWWLFGTAFFSATASALAGALSLRG